MRGGWPALLCILLAACAADRLAPEHAAILCKPGPDCDSKWSRAIAWVQRNSTIQSQDDFVILTPDATASRPRPSFTVTKSYRYGLYEISLSGACAEPSGCTPNLAEAKTVFANFVLAGDGGTNTLSAK